MDTTRTGFNVPFLIGGGNASGLGTRVMICWVSGLSFGTSMRERIFDPLGMKDTAFHVPGDKIDRLPPCYFFHR
jgi:hypothetical protein